MDITWDKNIIYLGIVVVLAICNAILAKKMDKEKIIYN
jgi:hypothetical protein